MATPRLRPLASALISLRLWFLMVWVQVGVNVKVSIRLRVRVRVGLRLVKLKLKLRVRVSAAHRTLSQSWAEGGGSESDGVEFWHRHTNIDKDAVWSSGFCCPSLLSWHTALTLPLPLFELTLCIFSICFLFAVTIIWNACCYCTYLFLFLQFYYLLCWGGKSLEKITFCTDCLFLNTFDSVLYFIVYPCIILL